MTATPFIRFAITFTFPLFLFSCAINQTSSVPGMTSNVNQVNEITEAQVLAALKCQMTRAFKEIEYLKQLPEYSKKENASSFKYAEGSGTFTGKLQSVKTATGSVNLVLPFSGFNGTNATPSYSQASTSTSLHQMTRTFDIDPDSKTSDEQLCTLLEQAGIDVGEFLQNSLVAGFTSLFDLPVSSDGSSFGPQLTNKTVETTSTFSVFRKHEGGFALKIVPSAPTVEEGTPGISKVSENSHLYTVTTKLPTAVAQISDSRRLLFCLLNQINKRLCIEEPYTDKRYAELQRSFIEDSEMVPGRRDEDDMMKQKKESQNVRGNFPPMQKGTAF